MTALHRRDFLTQATLGGAAVALGTCGLADEKKKPDFSLTVISGKPRERGRQYGEREKSAIRSMIDREIYQRLVRRKKEDMLRYAAACAKEIKVFSPEISTGLCSLFVRCWQDRAGAGNFRERGSSSRWSRSRFGRTLKGARG